MKTFLSLIKQHSALTYLALVFGISWGGILVILGPHLAPASGDEIGRLMMPLYLLMMAAPCVVGILMTGLVYGRSGLYDLLSHLVRWRVRARWYAVALLTTPLLATVALLALSPISSVFIPRICTADDRAFVVQFGIVSGLLVGLAEELGWTGFATPVLRQRYGVIATGVIIGLVIGVWHMPLVYWTSSGAAGDLPPALYLPAVTLTWLPAYRVLMVWVYGNTSSLFLAILMHTSLIAFWYILTPLVLAGVTMAAYYLLFTALVWGLIAVIALAKGWKLERQSLLHRLA